MLFDLRSPHRRRIIKVVYLFLAVLIGVGLVGFGIGNGSNFGGLFSTAGGGGGTAAGAGQYTKALKKAEKAAQADPSKASLWATVGIDAYAVATLPTNYSSSQGFTAAGHVALNQLRTAWDNYLSDAPANPDSLFAQEVVQAFSTPPTGVGDYKTAESAQEVVTTVQPTYEQYEYLAYYSWLAHDIAQGNEAAVKARSLATTSDIKTVDATLTEMASLAEATVGATGATGVSGPTGASG